MKKRATRPPLNLRDPRFLAGSVMILLAVAFCLFTLLYKPKPVILTPERVFTEAKDTKDFIQVSLYTVSAYKGNKVAGGGHVRYVKDGQIYGYGSGVGGTRLTLIFMDTDSQNFKKCAEYFLQTPPFKKELFVAGVGLAGTGGLINPATGLPGSPSVITFKSIKECGYADLDNNY